MYDSRTTIADFLDAAAARQPAPGGGSISALAGALAASMGEMVLNYSINRKGHEDKNQTLKPLLAEFTRARQMLLELMVEDQAAFELVSRLRKLPADAPERQEKYAPALLACIHVPQAMAATSLAMLELCDRVIEDVNPYLLSDLAVCADLAMATARCAVYNVRVNLKDLPDEQERQNVQNTTLQLLSKAGMIVQNVSHRIWTRDSAS